MHRIGAWRVLAALLIALLPTTPAVAGIGVGDTVPSVTLSDAAGRSVGLESLRGRIVVLDFTASWCVACRTALPELETLARRYAERGVTVVTVAIDAARADADRFLADVLPDRTMTILYDPSSRGLARFGASGMPAHYVVDERGVVRFAASGYTPERVGALAAAIDRVLAERSTSR